MGKSLTRRDVDYSKWYNELVVKADLAENSAVRGCMTIKPYGYAIWEKIQAELDKKFKETGHQNAYFPLLVPKHLFEAEETNAEGFAKECAVVTHYRLKNDEDNPGKLKVDETAKLEEELIIRPTSEALIWNTFKSWIQSYRDLPLKINQWANVMRWEMRTRLFLRTAEFLWQEGHTAHITKEEAIEEAELMNGIYADFTEKFMAIPVIKGLKTESERFAGADETYCIEALMQDGKALQAGTSHFLGQNFAKAFDVKYTGKDGKQDYVWATSWGVSTRLMGALIMTHSDDNGLVLPPNLAPYQVVIVPIFKNDEQFAEISKVALQIKSDLQNKNISVKFDDRDTHKPGWKFAQHEMQGVPLRIAIGPKDLEKGTVELARRDTLEKSFVNQADLTETIKEKLEEIQNHLFDKALKYRDEHITEVNTYEEFKEILESKGGFISAHWDGSKETEEQIKNETKATIRCIPEHTDNQSGECIITGQASQKRVLFAKAY
ncbi:MAG: proline--tRNA ligase [Psychroflexus sp.]|nr:proline--tRNA ligase [Psychroflexus sp.]MDN6309974.1 proline--tRNA ligase [Psychroflexus sp.]